MSRHRNLYDEDDLYDYDDDYYDDNYDDGDYSSTSSKKSAPAKPASKSKSQKTVLSGNTTTPTNKSTPTIPSTAKRSQQIPHPTSSAKAKSTKEPSSVQSVDIECSGLASLRMTPSLQDQIPSDDEDVTRAAACIAIPRLPRITLIVAGHVDAGKSTLVGNLLFQSNMVDQRTIHKYQKESREAGKGSFAMAWVMDESESERAHGVTMNIAERTLSTASKHFVILDSPGHRDFVPTMISGASQADVALLVVPAAVGEYESAVGINAQTREHAALLKALGVAQIVIVVNKMDATSPAWSQERYEAIVEDVRDMLHRLQFDPRVVTSVPVSGFSGVNLTTPLPEDSPLLEWYNGPTLLQVLDQLRTPSRDTQSALRGVVTSVGSESSRGLDVGLTILRGCVRVGRSVGIPSATSVGAVLTVRKLVLEDGTVVDEAGAGESVTATLVDKAFRSGDELGIRNGMVIYKGPPLVRCVMRFQAVILTLSAAALARPMLPGSSFELYLHGDEVLCSVAAIICMYIEVGGGGGGGGQIVKRPKCLAADSKAVVEIVTTTPVCAETYASFRPFGRFALRTGGKTCAIGICEKLL